MAQVNVKQGKKKKNYKFLSRMKKRLLVVIGFALAAFVVLIVNIIKINVNKGKAYEQKVLSQQGYSSTAIPFKRGDIIDSNGTVLATSKKVYNIILEPKNILDNDGVYYESTANALKEYFGFTDEELAEALADPNSYYKVTKKKQDYELVKSFKDFCKTDEGRNVRGVYFEEEYIRVYPNGNLACHLLGYTVSGNVGQYGIEQYYNEELNGSNGREYTYLNEEYGLTDTVEAPVNGYNLVTSIDANIQKIIQEKVDAYMTEEGAKNVSVLVMDPSTCSILALYNSHSFDPNDAQNLEAVRYQFDNVDPEDKYQSFEEFEANCTDEERVEALNEVWRNFAISDVFEPGSTYKTFTISGALEEGVIQPSDTFYCDGGEQKDTFYIKCHYAKHGGHGMLDVAGALANSCNDALMQIAVKEGSDTFDKYQVLFGFGQRTNVDLPGEPSNAGLASIVYHADSLHVTELATSSFGQGVCASMIQIGTAFCSVINGGYYYQPRVVQRIEDENGNIIDNMDNVLVRRTISEETSAIMRDELFGVVENGTGKRASVEGYTIGGKTGTAEKLPRGNGKYIISFIGFAPIDNPQVVVYVVVDEPNVEDQGSSAASSFIFADIAAELFPYMNIYKTNDNYDLDLIDAEDEPAESIYEGDAPENDVAGGSDNPYVEENNTTEGTEPTGENTEAGADNQQGATTENAVPEPTQ
ncbi:MAG: penicillin-binding protein 2 [Lachnospiraceae bacterium]|nr:penicillin-binding protein 2 [Lachnospiraceae bacterium]